MNGFSKTTKLPRKKQHPLDYTYYIRALFVSAGELNAFDMFLLPHFSLCIRPKETSYNSSDNWDYGHFARVADQE
jgi:hypothetical protein